MLGLFCRRLSSASSRQPIVPCLRQIDRLHVTANSEPDPFVVLGIESSCDDTGVAIVRSDGRLLGEAHFNQAKTLTERFGGINPSAAAEGHAQVIDEAVEIALAQAQSTLDDVDVVACTTGPGLAACLNVGLRKAKHLVYHNKKPFVAVNHLEAHALTPRLYDKTVQFPFLVLLVSGGNCQLVLASDLGEYARLGATLDDAPGEAYDKVARYLGIAHQGLSGGVAVERAAMNATAPVKLVVPLSTYYDCNFSFSGLKSQVRRLCESGDRKPLDAEKINNIAAGFQEAVVKHISTRTERAIMFAQQRVPSLSSLIVSGGVASNRALRDSLEALTGGYGIKLVCPPPRLCTDNGVMIAWAGVERYARDMGVIRDIDSVQSFRYEPQWPLGQDISQQVTDAQIRLVKRRKLRSSIKLEIENAS